MILYTLTISEMSSAGNPTNVIRSTARSGGAQTKSDAPV